MRVLLIEDHTGPSISQFDDDQTATVRVNGADEAISRLRQAPYDLILLNMAGHAAAGLALIHHLRTRGYDMPLLAVTGTRITECSAALGLGADDAMAHPVDPTELRSRMAAILQRRSCDSRDTQPLLQWGDLSLCQRTHDVRFQGQSVALTDKECAVLELLVLWRGTPVTKALIADHLCMEADAAEIRIIDVLISKLGRKMARAGAVDIVQTVPGSGYAIREAAICGSRAHNDPNMPERLVA